MKPLYKREDARRLARTLVTIRGEQGEVIPGDAIRRMQTLPANVMAQYAARPAAFRSVTLAAAKPNVVVLRYSCDGGAR